MPLLKLPCRRPFSPPKLKGLMPLAIAAVIAAASAADGGDKKSVGQVTLQVGTSHPTLIADKKQTSYVRIALTGSEIESSKKRPPVNVAIVIDNSGSMNGSKIDQARRAAIAAIKRLRDDDIVSVVLYNSNVSVLVPATKASDRDSIIRQIESVQAGGSTALFAGVSKGAAETRKFMRDESVNRVILLSDGQANVGPSSPSELENLGASLVKEGISVSTLGLGLGYNEDLMSGLAIAGSGNHMFIEEADDLVAVFNKEFNDLLSVVAGDFEIEATLAEGVRPVKVLGTNADIVGQKVFIPLTQLYSSQERYFVVEVEVAAGKAGTSRSLVDVTVNYINKINQTPEKLTASLGIRFTDDETKVTQDRDLETLAFCSVQIANERNRQATLLRDSGQIGEAEKLLKQNTDELKALKAICVAKDIKIVLPALEVNIELNRNQASTVRDESKWYSGRKMMREAQNYNQSQQRALPSGIKSGYSPK
jgi:Ca-activated chloride channel family protein